MHLGFPLWVMPMESAPSMLTSRRTNRRLSRLSWTRRCVGSIRDQVDSLIDVVGSTLRPPTPPPATLPKPSSSTKLFFPPSGPSWLPPFSPPPSFSSVAQQLSPLFPPLPPRPSRPPSLPASHNSSPQQRRTTTPSSSNSFSPSRQSHHFPPPSSTSTTTHLITPIAS